MGKQVRYLFVIVQQIGLYSVICSSFQFVVLLFIKYRIHNVEKQSNETDTKNQLGSPLAVYRSTAPLLKTETGLDTNERNRSKPSSQVPNFGRFKVFPEKFETSKKRILDPGSDVFLQWSRIFLFWCLVALFIDPLFFYLPLVVQNGTSYCMTTDLNLGITVTFFRTFADVFYLLHLIIKFRTAYVSPSSRIFGRGELVMDPKMISRRYLKSDFCIDLAAALPLPQVYKLCNLKESYQYVLSKI